MIRNVIYEMQFTDELHSLESDSVRADDLIRGTEWALQRNPRIGTLVHADPPVWFIPAMDVFDLPYVMYYTFDEKKVYMISIRLAEAKFNAAPEEE